MSAETKSPGHGCEVPLSPLLTNQVAADPIPRTQVQAQLIGDVESNDIQPFIPDDAQPFVPDDSQPFDSDDAQPFVPDDAQQFVPDDDEQFGPDDNEPFDPEDIEPFGPDAIGSDGSEGFEPDTFDDGIWVDLFVTFDIEVVNMVIPPAKHYNRMLIYSIISFHLGMYVGIVLYPILSKTLRSFLN